MKNAQRYICTFTDPYGICEQVAKGVNHEKELNRGQQHDAEDKLAEAIKKVRQRGVKVQPLVVKVTSFINNL